MSGKRIKLTDIAGTDRLRSVNEVNAAQIAASIEEVGLKYPILVRWVSEGKYALVDGAHRYRAHEMLGRTEI